MSLVLNHHQAPVRRALSSLAHQSRFDRGVEVFITTAFFSYCIRDGLASLVRYYLQKTGLNLLWFVPDVLAFGAFLLFIYIQVYKEKNFFAVFFVVSFIFSCFISILFMNDTPFALVSTIKLFIPLFVGLCFAGRSLEGGQKTHVFLLVIFFACAIGVAINPFVDYPWSGETITTLGVEREVSRVWWSEGAQRYGGVSGDSTLAGFMTIFTFVLVSPYRGILFNVLCWPLIYFAIKATDSKTSMGVFYVYVLYYIYIQFVPKAQRIRHLRAFTLASFVCLLVPPILMITLGGVDLPAIDPILFSLWDRINNTWNGPFLALADLFPVGYLTGCGIGCYSYPMLYTDLAKDFIPLDNFYLTTFIMMGYPFLLFVVVLFVHTRRNSDPIQLMILMLWNIYTVTVQSYGPSYANVLFGYAVSGLFTREAMLIRFNGLSRRGKRRNNMDAAPAQ